MIKKKLNEILQFILVKKIKESLLLLWLIIHDDIVTEKRLSLFG